MLLCCLLSPPDPVLCMHLLMCFYSYAVTAVLNYAGGSVVFMGGECRTEFADVVFERCTLVVMAGDQATLERPQFREMHASERGPSIFAHGSGTSVSVQGGGIKGGKHVVMVQAGASRGLQPGHH